MARCLPRDDSETHKMTPRVVTIWYRAPELLLGAETYDETCDMWSIGCIMAEMLTGTPLFPENNEIEMFRAISGLLGAPHDGIWPSFRLLPGARMLNLGSARRTSLLENKFRQHGRYATQLLQALLVYDPRRRGSAVSALQNAFFATEPLAVAPEKMHFLPQNSEYDEYAVDKVCSHDSSHPYVFAADDMKSLHKRRKLGEREE